MARLSQHYFILASICLLLLLQACNSDDSIPKNDSEYAPVEVGHYWVYEVHDERYSLTESPILSTYFLKETIGELLSTTQAGKTYKLIRYKRNQVSDIWKADSIWTVQQWPDKLIRTENNVSYIKLFFPIATGMTWNQNEYNALPSASYRYENVGKPYSLKGNNYPTTLQVVSKQNDSTAISLNRQSDVYAYQTGLIFKETTALAYCQSSPDCIGKGQIAYGYRRKLTLIETGKE